MPAWDGVADLSEVPVGITDWDEDLVGADGFTMPATQHDAWLWISGSSRTAVFDAGTDVLRWSHQAQSPAPRSSAGLAAPIVT